MIWLPFIIIAIVTALFLTLPLTTAAQQTEDGARPAKPSPLIALFFLGFITLALGTYAVIGRVDLTRPDALKSYKPQAGPVMSGPTQADITAAQTLSPEARQEMILGMLASLAAKLDDNPENPEGWARLLRSQIVMGQEDAAQETLTRINEVYKDRPALRAQIIAAGEGQPP